ncbi:unnamed protein product [Lactuca saligna]|uniref:Uncharacterized protein n=1 Tax=Lactuca saligna TaxID=75948 RepID=A0AA36ELW4_LACSI|nr:unnamed protein product [Lactuca saligna]
MCIHPTFAVSVGVLFKRKVATAVVFCWLCLSFQNIEAKIPDGIESFTTTRSEKKQRAISSAISLLTNKKTRDLIMILNSKRFVEIFVNTLEQKKHHEAKLKEGLKDLAIKHMELQNSLSLVWPKQEATVAKTRDLKKVCLMEGL